MATPAYSLAAWRKYREEQEQSKQESPAGSTLTDIPVDAEMDAGIVIGFWNGERFVSWEKWLATAPILREESIPALPEGAPGCAGKWSVNDDAARIPQSTLGRQTL